MTNIENGLVVTSARETARVEKNATKLSFFVRFFYLLSGTVFLGLTYMMGSIAFHANAYNGIRSLSFLFFVVFALLTLWFFWKAWKGKRKFS